MTLTRFALSLAALTLVTTGAARAQDIRADHTTVDPSGIPQEALDAARALTMTFSHASVGWNLWNGLSTMAGQDAARYSLPNWTENDRGNPGWAAKFSGFETWVLDHQAEYQVFLNKLCWIDQDASFTAYRDSMVGLAQAYPNEKFVWFTMPLSSDGAEGLRAAYNQSVRAYAAEHNLPLFDIADIESHAPDGTLATTGGVETLHAAYSADNGHLVGEGQTRVAGAMWYLMARLAGWNSGGTSSSSGPVVSSSAGATSGPAPGSSLAAPGTSHMHASSVMAASSHVHESSSQGSSATSDAASEEASRCTCATPRAGGAPGAAALGMVLAWTWRRTRRGGRA